ncbi:MAG TPA: MMPL family transporter [Candidatus Limnocylindria bacterium]|nr:MMPL family transporter [Candidatus Limnocylindria bacterium]
MFAAWARFVHRFRWPVLLGSGLLMAASIVVVAQGGTLKSGGIIETSESGRALDLLQEELPRASGSSFFLIFESDRLRVVDAEFRSALESALAAVRSDPRVEAVRTPYDTTPPIPSFVSRDGTKAYAVVSVKDDISGAARYYDELRAKISSDALRITASGNIAITEDFNEILESDLQRAELVSLPLALVLLLIVFGTVVAALLPLGVGVLSVLAGVAGTYVLTSVTDVSQYALNVVTLIGLGVAIDYSLFIVNRFREELRRTADVERALERGLSTAGRAVLFSGLTVAIGLSGMLFYEGTFLSSMGLAGSIVVAFAVVYALTFLPALLSLLGPRVNAWRVPIGGRGGEGTGLWHALATRVMRRPLAVLLPLLVIIGFTASPFARLHLANGDVSMLPRHVESRRGYDLLVSEFPGQETTQMTVVVRYADGAPLSRERIPALVEYVRRLEALPDVLRVDSLFGLDTRAFPSPPAAPAQPARPLTVAEYQALYGQPREQLPQSLQVALRQAVGEHIVTVSVVTTKDKKSADAQALVRRMRAEAPPPGAETLVTGLTAFDIDVVQFIVERSPYAIGWVMLATYVVLFLLLGSVVLPLKAVLMNLISISTSFGALVWIFQEGNLAWLLGGFTPGPLDPTLPVIMFCSVFGLSMDYEVLLLSRIQEQYRRSADNTRAVAQGLERSGRLITGAAAIMVGVFLAFSLAEVVIIKALGFGMALAVAIDATIVRALVVPATMRLLGRANWWAPGPLARLYDRLRLGESPRPPVTAGTEAD